MAERCETLRLIQVNICGQVSLQKSFMLDVCVIDVLGLFNKSIAVSEM